MTTPKKLLHVGCGQKRKNQTTAGFNTDDWIEIRYDIDSTVEPDVTGSITDLAKIESGSVDGVFSSHNIEHLYAHEVPIALKEFNRVLSEDGFLVITCPDLKSICQLVVQDQLEDAAYSSPAGPIMPLDVIYGFSRSIEDGNTFMAHKTGFTKKTLAMKASQSGYANWAAAERGAPYFDLWLLATKSKKTEEEIQSLCKLYFTPL